MKTLELKGTRPAMIYSQGGLLAEFLGTAAQGAELVAKFNQHAELVKALRALAGDRHDLEHVVNARWLLAQIDAEAA